MAGCNVKVAVKTTLQCVPHAVSPNCLLSRFSSNIRSTGSGNIVRNNYLSLRRQFVSTDSKPLARTAFYDAHVAANARMGQFAGFAMPFEYTDQTHRESHHWTRKNASLFDVSHMVQHSLSGPLAEEFLMTVTPSSINELRKNESTLSALLNHEGGIVDDTIITRTGRDHFHVVTNAGNRDTDIAYLEKERSDLLKQKATSAGQLEWKIHENSALLALQGPASASILQSVLVADSDSNPSSAVSLSDMYFGQLRHLKLKIGDGLTVSAMVWRTGYTGEDGFEISISASDKAEINRQASSLAETLTKDSRVRWAGLAARDSLRLEAGMCLYGHDINETITPPMAGLGWIVGKSRRTLDGQPRFNGHTEILKHLESPKSMPFRRVGLLVSKGPSAREGAEVVDAEGGQSIGKVTSGCPSPTLNGQNIAMALVQNGYHKKGTLLGVKVRGKVSQAEVVKLPFVEDKFHRNFAKAPA